MTKNDDFSIGLIIFELRYHHDIAYSLDAALLDLSISPTLLKNLSFILILRYYGNKIVHSSQAMLNFIKDEMKNLI